MNKLSASDKVVCISEDFPIWKTTSENKSDLGKLALNHPKIGEILEIDEVLGDFLRFDKYDCNDPGSPHFGINWWHHTRFRTLSETTQSEKAYESRREFNTLPS